MKANISTISSFKKRNDGYAVYQMTMPVMVHESLKVNYEQVFTERGYRHVDSVQKTTNDLLYFDIVEETFQDGFEMFYKDYSDIDEKFLIRGAREKTLLSFKVLEQSIIMPTKCEKEKYSEYEMLYISLVVEDTCEHNLKPELVTSILSRYESKVFGANVVASIFENEQDPAARYFYHGKAYAADALDRKVQNLLKFLGITAYEQEVKNLNKEDGKEAKLKINRKYCEKLIFPNGKNMFVTFFINSDSYLNRIREAIDGGDDDLLLNIYETSNCYNVFVADRVKLVSEVFFRKWIKADSVTICSPNSFGMVCNQESKLDPELIFCKYNIAIFFSLQQRMMNIELQEILKGVKPNSYQEINNYYKRLEQVVFYEISSELQLQTLYSMMQYHFKNDEITAMINTEMEIHQNRRLNDLFKRLTEYGIYLAVVSLIIAIPSYFATYMGVPGLSFEKFSRTMANPLTFLGLTLVLLFITARLLSRKDR